MAEPWDKKTKERLVLVALSYGEISIGRALELLPMAPEKLRETLQRYTGATLPDGQHMSYADAISALQRIRGALDNKY